MIKLIPLLLFLTSHPARAAHFDPPDLNLELDLHRQYLKLEKPSLIEQKNGQIENYRLQPGENLWGLSRMLYGDGNYWPKIWAQNRSITNPHLIRPGHVLQFWMGSEDDAPSFRFSETPEGGGGGLELAVAGGGNSASPQVEIPEPETPPHPVLKLPRSFPQWQTIFYKSKDLKLDDSHISLNREPPPEMVPLMAYVQDEPLVSIGSFLELEKESGLPDARQYVYVKLKKGQGQVGQKLLIAQDQGRIKKLTEQVEGNIKARLIEIFGDLQLTDVADPSVNENDDGESSYFRALILHALSLSLTNYQLIPGELQYVDMKKEGPLGQVNAQLIGSAKSSASGLYGPGEIVFLNKGSDDGVEVGQMLKIHIDRMIRDIQAAVNFSKVSSGAIRVVKVSKTCSTAVVLTAKDSLQQGDRTQPHIASGDEAKVGSKDELGLGDEGTSGGGEQESPPGGSGQESLDLPSDDKM